MSVPVTTSFYQYCIEEEIPKKDNSNKRRGLLSTRKQAKLMPVIYTDNYYNDTVDEWYYQHAPYIDAIFDQFVSVYQKRKINFYVNIDDIFYDFVEFLYYHAHT